MRWHPKFPIVVLRNVSALLKDFEHLYYVADWPYWSREFIFFEFRISERQKTFGKWHNVELFSWKSSDRVRYYSSFPCLWMPCEPTTLLFVSSPFAQLYCNGFAMWGSTADQTRIWTIALTDFVLMAGEMFNVGARDGTSSTY